MKQIVAAMLMSIATLPLAAAVKIIDERLLMVAPDTNTATGIIHLRNDDPKAAAPLFLELDDFTTAYKKAGLGTTRKIGKLDETPTRSYLDVTIPANGELRIVIDVANLREPGYSTAILKGNDKEIGKIRALKDHFPFNVAPPGWKDDAPLAVQTADDGRIQLSLKNSDPVTYPVAWKLVDDGKVVKEQPQLPLRDNTSVSIEAADKRAGLRWWDWLSGFFKNPKTDAVLTVSTEWTSRTFPLRIEHVLLGTGLRTAVSTFIVLFVLLLGACASLYVTYSIPNRIRRLNLREAIEAPSGTIRRLSNSIFSTLRTGLRVERMRLVDRLKSRWTLSPDFGAVAADCENGAKLLAREVEMLAHADRVYRQIDELWQSTRTLGPTVLRRACTLLGDAQKVVAQPEISEAELQTAEAKVAEAETLVAGAPLVDDVFLKGLAERVQRCVTRRKSSLKDNTTLADFLAQVKELGSAVDEEFVTAANINVTNVSCIDFAVAKMELLMVFLDAYAILDDKRKQQCDPTLARLLDALRMHSFSEFRRAEGFVAQMRERIYSFDIQEALTTGQAHIDWEPQRPKVNQSVDYSVALVNPRYNGAAAQLCFTCHWDFGDGWRKEKGWKVSHYFITPGPHEVSVTFTDDQGRPLVPGAGCGAAVMGTQKKEVKFQETIPVQGSTTRKLGERSRIEAVQLAIVLLVACFALLAGANDQLAKVDLVPGLIAVFVLGFSADQIKTALAGRK